MKSSPVIGRVRFLYKTDVSTIVLVPIIRDLISTYQIPDDDDDDRDGHRNVGFLQKPDGANSPR
jgi:hypothetical protein